MPAKQRGYPHLPGPLHEQSEELAASNKDILFPPSQAPMLIIDKIEREPLVSECLLVSSVVDDGEADYVVNSERACAGGHRGYLIVVTKGVYRGRDKNVDRSFWCEALHACMHRTGDEDRVRDAETRALITRFQSL